MRSRIYVFAALMLMIQACQKKIDTIATEEGIIYSSRNENPGSFSQIGAIKIGGTGAAEISAFDPETNKLFVVNNSTVNRIEVLDLSNPALPVITGSIELASAGGFVNSLSVHKGHLAAAVENAVKQEPGKVLVFRTDDHSLVRSITVGALPDMITYSPDGKFILTANEGEPNSSYTVDPVGTVSIISVQNDYTVVNLDFSAFASQANSLKAQGLRVYGPNASFAQDMEPEYVTVSEDSRTAWVTLQENNAIAKIDLLTKTVTSLMPLGFKNYSLSGNLIDPTDRPLGTIAFGNWPVYGMYQPDAIAVLDHKGLPYLFTANEGDAREYSAFAEEGRVSTLNLDPTVFPNAATLKNVNNMGRLNVTKSLGDTDGDGDYDALYTLGGRSFSVWNGNSGALVWESRNGIESRAVAAGWYDDDRSDNKGVEPEGITLGRIKKTVLAFVGLERADAVAIYDVTNPVSPVFLQILQTGDAPEGVLFVEDQHSPVKRSLLIVSSENDGFVRIYAPAEQ